MSTEQSKPAAPAPKPRDWLPIRQVWFVARTPLPDGQTVTTQRGDCQQTNVAHFQIEYGPAHRMFRFTYSTPDPAKEPVVRMVMEHAVQSFEAMPL